MRSAWTKGNAHPMEGGPSKLRDNLTINPVRPDNIFVATEAEDNDGNVLNGVFVSEKDFTNLDKLAFNLYHFANGRSVWFAIDQSFSPQRIDEVIRLVKSDENLNALAIETYEETNNAE